MSYDLLLWCAVAAVLVVFIVLCFSFREKPKPPAPEKSYFKSMVRERKKPPPGYVFYKY